MIYEYTKEKRDICVKLYMDVYTSAPWFYDWMTEENISRYFEDMENTPCFLGFIYEECGEVMGFCVGATSDYFIAKTYELKEIAVQRLSQGQGVGGQILKEVEEYLRETGVTTITLATQRSIGAFNFYMKNGYMVSEGAVYLSKGIDD